MAFKKVVAMFLAIAMLVTNLNPSLPTLFAQEVEQVTDSTLEIENGPLKGEEKIDYMTETVIEESDAILSNETMVGEEKNEDEVEYYTLTLHYSRLNQDYLDWNVWVWGNGQEGKSYDFTHYDEYGYLVDIEVPAGAEVGYIIKKGDWLETNVPNNQFISVTTDTEIWIEQNQEGYHLSSPNGLAGERIELPKVEEPNLKTHTLTLHYNRTKQDYEGWDVWLWESQKEGEAFSFTSEDEFGKIINLQLKEGIEYGYKIRKTDWSESNHPQDQFITITEDKEIWITQGQSGYHEVKPDLNEPDLTPIDLVIHYERPNKDYEGYELYTWGSQESEFVPFDFQDQYGKTTVLSFNHLEDVKKAGFIVYQNVEGQNWWENKDGGDKANIQIDQLNLIQNVDKYVAHIYIKQESDTIYYTNPNKEVGDYSTVTVHYRRDDANYEQWNLWTWDTGAEDGQHTFEWQDEHSIIATIKVKTGNTFGYIIRKGDWLDKNHPDDQKLVVKEDTEIWVDEGQNGFDAIGPNGTWTEIEEEPFEDPVSDAEAELQVFIHYYRYLEDYRNWNVWAWGEGLDGFGYPFTEVDEFGKVAKINVKDAKDLDKLGFIIRKGDWTDRDGDKDRFIDLSYAKEIDGRLQLHAYIIQNEEMIYYTPDIDKTPALSGATFTDLNQLKVSAPIPFDDVKGVSVTQSSGATLGIKDVTLSKDKLWLFITLDEEINLGETYSVSKTGFRAPAVVEYYGIFDSEAFNEKFYYDGNDLGASYTKESTTFKVWAPTASEVKLQLYQSGHQDDLYKEIDMVKGEKGVWKVTESGDLNQVYYTYKITVGNNTEVAVDPYARTVGVNGNRGMVINLETTNPKNWVSDVSPDFSGNMTDAIIYELHLRDLSTDEHSGIKNVGKYLQLTEQQTVSDKGVATGLDHLKEMGITHLHLLPSFDHRPIDETKLDQPQFNWGYDPQHYNAPEGSYSTDPYHGEVRVNEFKQMVQSLHENGIRVVMDVVYNHTGATADSDFNKIVPGYYYRQNEQGGFANGSGCGNETASERLMMRKFMIDSVSYWAQEYHIDGFRFDLMALHDVKTMNELEQALHEIDPSIIIYGEGWTGGGSPLPDADAAYKGNAKETPNIAYFNDDMRDAIKGNVGNDWESGYLNGNTSDYFYNRLKFGIVGSSYHDQVSGWDFWASNPTQSISYVSAHDNNTLFDKLLGVELAKGESGNVSPDYLKSLQKQANAMVLTGQGVPFLHAGVEMMRSKDGDHNSYQSPDSINQIDWNLKYENYDVVNYYKGLIELRKSNAAFRMTEATEVNKSLRFNDDVPTGVIAFNLDSKEDHTEQIAVIHNVTDQKQTISLPVKGEWSIVVNGEDAGTETLEVIQGESVEVTPHSTYVLMLDYQQPASANSQLRSLVVKSNEQTIELTPAFMPYIYQYNLTVDANVTELEIEGHVMQKGATISGINVSFLNQDNKVRTDDQFSGHIEFPLSQKELLIELTVTSENHEKESTYTLNVTRQENDDTDGEGEAPLPDDENGGEDQEPLPDDENQPSITPPTQQGNTNSDTSSGSPGETPSKPSTHEMKHPQTGISAGRATLIIGAMLCLLGGALVINRQKKE